MIDPKELRKRQRAGHKYVQVVVNRKQKPRSRRVRVMPGVLGTVIGPLDNLPNTYLVDVLIADLLAPGAAGGSDGKR